MRKSSGREDGRPGAPASGRGARIYALPAPPRESPLTPRDFDRALRRMKADLALTALKRQLLDPQLELDAKTVLSMVDQIEGLQREV